MQEIHVIKQDFTLAGIVDEYVSVIWKPSYSEIGDFELYIAAESGKMELLSKNRLLVRKRDITVDEDENTTYKKVMIIKGIELITDTEAGDFLKVTGRELKYLLHSRIVWTQTVLAGTAEEAIRRLTTENAIEPADSKRKIPALVLEDAAGLKDSIEKQVTGDYLDDVITEICVNYGYGWEIYIKNTTMCVRIYKGVNRSYGQAVLPYVVFSDAFENLYNTEYQENVESYANTTLIGGEGEGIERTFTTVGEENSGLDRYEVFTDARDISSNSGSDDEIPAEQYKKMLQERGKEKLSELAITEGFCGEVLSDARYKYGKDFNLGDTVTVISGYGIQRDVTVLSAVESEDETGEKLLPQFNM